MSSSKAQKRFASTKPTFLRYCGGKSLPHAYTQIKGYFPPVFKSFREPFCGGAGVTFSLDPSIPRWINDLNRPLMAVYEALKLRPKEFIEMCMKVSPPIPGEPLMTKKSGIQYPKRLWDLFYDLVANENADPAFRYLFLNRCSMFGRVILDPTRRHRNAFSFPHGWSHGLFERLAVAADYLRDASVTCSDYEWLFTEPGEEVLIFADPPYMRDTLLPTSAKLYEYSFGIDDHRHLRDIISQCPHKVILSYDDHFAIRDLYREFFIHEASWTYMGRPDKSKGRELIITNYPPLKRV